VGTMLSKGSINILKIKIYRHNIYKQMLITVPWKNMKCISLVSYNHCVSSIVSTLIDKVCIIIKNCSYFHFRQRFTFFVVISRLSPASITVQCTMYIHQLISNQNKIQNLNKKKQEPNNQYM
jgi:hydrogenase maturation factor